VIGYNYDYTAENEFQREGDIFSALSTFSNDDTNPNTNPNLMI